MNKKNSHKDKTPQGTDTKPSNQQIKILNIELTHKFIK